MIHLNKNDCIFSLESEMTHIAESWLKTQCEHVKKEFMTPWGICDLVGCSLNKHNVRKRLSYGQKKRIGSYFRVLLLSKIPDVQTSETISFAEIYDCLKLDTTSENLNSELNRLVKDKFIICMEGNRFQKNNGWAPLQNKSIALELKLSRLSDVFYQAKLNLEIADESYVGLPLHVAQKVVKNNSYEKHFNLGIGLVGFTNDSYRVLRLSKPKCRPHPTLQMYAIERFWL